MGQAKNSAKAKGIWIAAVVVLLNVAAWAQAEPRRVIISIPDRKLALLAGNRILKVYPVSVGKASSPSPTGKFRVVNRVVNPTYYHKGTVIGPGPENPLGHRWIGLSEKGYGIHGTNAPRSIGKAASHGCIRMAKADLEALFTNLRAGDEVEIRGERDTEIVEIFGSDQVLTAQVHEVSVAGGQ
jgi:L,D-transpeptidase ErfK/SrfK